jgi:uncharacterized protein YdeI (YjbR/CyaY-like superfamily)
MGAIRDEFSFPTRRELRSWLLANSSRTDGVWAVFYKKSTGLGDLSWEAIVEECLCFGWIDSLPGKVDDTRTKVYISPRKANSGWSRRNKILLTDLEQRGLMAPPGFAAVDRAKANGSWERFDLAEDLVIPHELSSIFARDPVFAEAWGLLTESKRRQFLQQIYDAKTTPTRLRRIDAIRSAICS